MENTLLQIFSVILPTVVTILLALLSLAANELKKKIKQEQVKSALEMAITITESGVNSLNKTTVPALREAAKDGRLTQSDMAKVKQIAVDTIKAELPDAMLDLLTKAKVVIDSRISTEIESQVLQAKFFDVCD